MKNLTVRGLAACLLAMTVALPTLAAPAQTASAPIKLTLEALAGDAPLSGPSLMKA